MDEVTRKMEKVMAEINQKFNLNVAVSGNK